MKLGRSALKIRRSVKIDLSWRVWSLIVGFFILIGFVGLSFAYGGNNPVIHGHSAGEIEGGVGSAVTAGLECKNTELHSNKNGDQACFSEFGSSWKCTSMVLTQDNCNITYSNLLARCCNVVGTTASSSVPSGAIMAFNLASCPTGWIVANGSSGTPDLRGTFVRGLDLGKGYDNGRVLGTYQEDAFKAHIHTYTLYPVGSVSSGGDTAGSRTGESFNTGSTGTTETRPKNVALLYCMKV